MRRQPYWFDEGGRLAIAIVRMAVAIAVLMVLANVRNLPLSSGAYRPLGIWMLVPTRPPELVIDALWVIACVSTIAMLVGLRSRTATAVSCVASIAIVSLSFATLPPLGRWAHGYNIVLLAQLALLGARCGDALSVDAVIRRLRGLPPLEVLRGYQWSLRLVQLAVALVFIGACSYKLAAGHGMAWAWSDNLRHQLLVRYDLAGLERTPLAQWLIDDAWRYRTAATLNLLSQMAPLAAILMPRRPIVRGVVACLFVAETLAIDQVMALPNLHWLPLAAVFIDWDRLLTRVPPRTLVQFTPPRAPRIFIAAFVAFDLLMTFVPRLDQRVGAYPFSSYPLFASVRAAKPWREHQPYIVPGDHFVVEPRDTTLDHILDHAHRRLFNVTDPAALEARLAGIRAQYGVSVRHHLALFVAPAYPAKARFEERLVATTAGLGPDGFRSVLGTWSRTTVTLAPRGVDTTGAYLVYYTADSADPRPLLATRRGDVFDVGLPRDAVHVVAIIDGEAWLVASMRKRK